MVRMHTIYIIKKGCLALPGRSQKVFLERLTVDLNLEGRAIPRVNKFRTSTVGRRNGLS